MSLKRFNQSHVHNHSSLFYNFIMNFAIRDFTLYFYGFLHILIQKARKLLIKQLNKHATPLNSKVPYSDIKLAVKSFIRQKWQREWDGQTENKFKEIKPCVATWSTFIPRKIDIILICLRMALKVDVQTFAFSRRWTFLPSLSLFYSYHSPSFNWLSWLASHVPTLFSFIIT